MLEKTRGIVLRAIKYGETSLICNIFTETYGVQAYLVQGVRSSKSKGQKAGLLQPATLLDIVTYNKPQANLQRMKEFHPAHIYQSVQEHIVKNSIALFSVELLLRVLPEQADMPELFDESFSYLTELDKTNVADVGNFPLFFIMRVSDMLGYDIIGRYSIDTPHLNLQEGGFTDHPPTERPFMSDKEARLINSLLMCDTLKETTTISMNGDQRFKLMEWYIAFLHNHSQHMAELKSLSVLRAILH